MRIACTLADQNFTDQTPCIAPHILKRFGENAAALGHEVSFFGPWKPGYETVWAEEFDVQWYFPGWIEIKEAVVGATRKMWAASEKANQPTVIVTDDLQGLRWHSRKALIHLPRLAICSNFKHPEVAWKAPCDEFIFAPYPPVDQMYDLEEKPPKIDVAYVGCHKLHRWKMLEKVDYPLVCLGPGWQKQDKFKYALNFMTKFKYLREAYRLAAWHISIQDPWVAASYPCVSRFAEAWQCRRPLLVHQSHVDNRPDLDWTMMAGFIWETGEDIRGYVAHYGTDLDALHHWAEFQRKQMFHQMYVSQPDPTPLIKYCESEIEVRR